MRSTWPNCDGGCATVDGRRGAGRAVALEQRARSRRRRARRRSSRARRRTRVAEPRREADAAAAAERAPARPAQTSSTPSPPSAVSKARLLAAEAADDHALRRPRARGGRSATRASGRPPTGTSDFGTSAGGVAEPLGLAAGEDDRLHQRRGRSARGRSPSYAKPAHASSAGSSMLRPSTKTARAHRRAASPPSRASASSRPLGHDHDGVGAARPPRATVATCSTPCRPSLRRDRVPGAHVGALGEQPPGQHEARRLAHVVGVRLEREAEQRDPSCRAASPSRSLELADHAPLLELVHLDHGVQQLEVVARVRRELLERERVLREARAAEADPGAEEALARSGGRARSPRRPSTTSAPVASQTFAISLMNEIRVISAAFAASLIISADATSQRTTGASIPSWSASTTSPSACVERADRRSGPAA